MVKIIKVITIVNNIGKEVVNRNEDNFRIK